MRDFSGVSVYSVDTEPADEAGRSILYQTPRMAVMTPDHTGMLMAMWDGPTRQAGITLITPNGELRDVCVDRESGFTRPRGVAQASVSQDGKVLMRGYLFTYTPEMVYTSTCVVDTPTPTLVVEASATPSMLPTPTLVVEASATPSDLATPTASFLGESGQIHIVQIGETLFSIAMKYGVTVEELVRANNLTDTNQLSVGQQLIIPSRP